MDKAKAKKQTAGSNEEDEPMNTAMIIELVIITILALACVIILATLRKKLKEYDGMGEVKKSVARRKSPSDKTIK